VTLSLNRERQNEAAAPTHERWIGAWPIKRFAYSAFAAASSSVSKVSMERNIGVPWGLINSQWKRWSLWWTTLKRAMPMAALSLSLATFEA
jgi:hypothetical protein